MGSLCVAGSAVYLDAAVCPSLGEPGYVFLQPVHVRVLGGVGAGLLNGGADVLHVLLREKRDRELRQIILTKFNRLTHKFAGSNVPNVSFFGGAVVRNQLGRGTKICFQKGGRKGEG